MALLLECRVLVLLAFFLALVPVWAKGNGPVLRRQKRAWIIAPKKLLENHNYGFDNIARIRSDKENFTKIIYELTGPGAGDTFQVDPDTGYVKIYAVLDREEIAAYHLKGIAKFASNRSYAEKNIDLNITVVDENDCPPVIKAQQVGYVNESSAAGTVVMKVIATDADQEDTDHSKIFYSIAEQSMDKMFSINAQTGEVFVRQNTLDRETKDTYKLIIKGADLFGRAGGNTGTGEIVVKILDINDNIPTLEKESYEGSVEENTVNVEVMRIKAIDKDLIHTDNWLAVYEIVSGNEAGYFTITTDSETNEGIITIHKALDYEELKALNLEVEVNNKAGYNFGSSSVMGTSSSVMGTTATKRYPVKINVINQKEGPRFQPTVKVVPLSEDMSSTSINKIITTYFAIDSDTLQKATNVWYRKKRDDDNWLIIDEKTADIRLNKLPDRESKFLVNGTYYAEIICINNDIPSKTATGTIAIQVEDFNDHCPKLTTTAHTMCLEDNVIYVTAVDEDAFPNSAPFEFSVIQESSKGKWTVEHFNDTTAILRDQANLWPGNYKIALLVKDQQGKSCADVQVMDLTVCACPEHTKSCMERISKTAGFGAAGILLLLLGLLLLLLVPLLLLFCLCGGTAAIGDFKAIPFDTKQQLISYHTEGQGEDKDVPLLHGPMEVDMGAINANNINTFESKPYTGGFSEMGAVGAGAGLGSAINTAENMHMYSQYRNFNGQEQMNFTGAGTMAGYGAGAFDDMALSDQFLGEYYLSKSIHAAEQSQVKDGLMIYNYEGQESLAGSVGCCSLLEDANDLAFLNDLGPKFKTLAEICQGSALVTETVDAGVSVSPPRPSTHTHVHTHTETVRDRDRVNINTLDTSNVASGSSTIVQEELITERAQGSATVPKVHVQDKMMIPSQTLLIQQPAMYYAAAPMYVVEPNPQMVLVAGGTQQSVGQVGQVGLSQGLMQVGGLQGSQGVVLVDRQVGMGGVTGQVGQGLVQVGGLQGSQGVVLVDRQVGMGGVTGQVGQGLSKGTISSARQVLVVENGSSGGGQGEHLAHGFVQTGQGLTEQSLGVKGQGVQVKSQTFSLGSHGSTGSNEDFGLTATPKLQGSQRVVVQHKKVSVTEKRI
uniref:desmoglein-2 isoform X2 n=1 Tax=Monopterus albus TaxID=43700 RepID=UPI0009B4E28A|nr:desmoglein-2-like isoform X2 [Monopterus albus]XP_020451506.1 desmoglein-2-like isoform X3 [Monopterus albus]